MARLFGDLPEAGAEGFIRHSSASPVPVGSRAGLRQISYYRSLEGAMRTVNFEWTTFRNRRTNEHYLPGCTLGAKRDEPHESDRAMRSRRSSLRPPPVESARTAVQIRAARCSKPRSCVLFRTTVSISRGTDARKFVVWGARSRLYRRRSTSWRHDSRLYLPWARAVSVTMGECRSCDDRMVLPPDLHPPSSHQQIP